MELFKRNARVTPPPCAVRTLADLRAGERGRVTCLDCPQRGRCERLMAYGLFEGQCVLLMQRKPVFVVRVDETELALDEQVARCIHIALD